MTYLFILLLKFNSPLTFQVCKNDNCPVLLELIYVYQFPHDQQSENES